MKRTIRPILLAMLLTLSLAAPVRADDDDRDDDHPVLSKDDAWVRYVVYGTAATFAAAAIIGPIVLMRRPGIVADATSHEEDPSADKHQKKH